MIRRAIGNYYNMELIKHKSIDKSSDGNYYSIDQLRSISDLISDYDPYIICGDDVDISKWKCGDWILDHFKVLKISRDVVKMSSTKVRKKVKEGIDDLDLARLVENNNVVELIRSFNLYNDEE